MTYYAKTNRGLQLVFFSLCVLIISISIEQHPGMLYYLIPLAILTLITIFINYSLTISDGAVRYQICIFSLPIHNREVNHEQITALKFKRVGWSQKCVVVKNRKGLNFRVINFNPNTVLKDLINFASDYDIPIFKTKDYTILDK